MIAAAAIPAFEPGIRAQLHHPKGPAGPGKSMPVASGTNKGGSPACKIRLCRQVSSTEQQGKEQAGLGHTIVFAGTQ